jgi:hypothetical protein
MSLGTSEEITANPNPVDPDDRHEGKNARDTCPDRAVNELEVLGVRTDKCHARDVDHDHGGACREAPPDILQGRPARDGLGRAQPNTARETSASDEQASRIKR